jgi:hypothetical protein
MNADIGGLHVMRRGTSRQFWGLGQASSQILRISTKLNLRVYLQYLG